MLTVTKMFQFDYAHKLPNHHGKCQNLHGHTGKLEIEVSEVDNPRHTYPGMIIDFGDLKKIVSENVIEVLDHAYLNEVLPVVPTAENTTLWIKSVLEPFFGKALRRIRVYETPDSYAEWKI
jgi:6-pyruvoyltetrahydropterin/6-carboxytetrahydropterin synthase